MSKSKASAPAAPKPRSGARARWSAILRGGDGRVRAGWTLVGALLAWIAVSTAARGGLTAAFAALFEAWGIDAGNARLAPGWARLVYRWHGSAITLLSSLLLIALSLGLRRLFRVKGGATGRGAALVLAGLGAAAGSAALFLLTDSLRLEWPVSEPRLSPALPALLAISLAGVLAEELFCRRVIQDLAAERWGRLRAAGCACVTFFAVGGGLSGGVVGAVNVLMLGAVCGLLYERLGLMAAVALRWGWSAANLFLLGFGGGHSLYRLYAVSETRLTGGDAGLMCGLWCTLLLFAALAWLERGALARLGRRERS